MFEHFRVFLCALAIASGTAQAQSSPVASVARVDLARYAGTWYEIAAFPMFFQRQCVGDTTAQYTLRTDGEIDVYNRCRTETGFDDAKGRAWPAGDAGTARLKVSFFWPFRSDYWVIGLADDYAWAVVGNPNRKYLWVLSRTPRLAPEQLERALQAAAAQGYDLAQLKYTPQGQASALR